MAIDPKTGIDRSAIDAFNAQSLANAQKNYQGTNTYQATPLPTPPVTATPPKRMLTIPKEGDLATSPILPPAPTVPAPTVANPATGDLAAMIAKDKADYEASQKPKPTVATAQNPVVVRARQDKEAFSIPQSQDIINMDKNSVYDYMDRLEIKLNKGQALSDQEQLSLRALKRREAELTKPQPIEVLNDLAIQQQKEIGATEQQLKEQDAKDLQAFAQSQDAYKQAQLAVIDQAGEESIKTLGYILGAQGTATSTSGAEAINKIRQNVALQKQAKIAEVQANIDLKESQLRKDSQETINKMKDRLYNTQLESAKYDVMNIQALNEYNASEAKSNIEKLDALDAMSQSIIANNRPLTEAEMQQSQARSESLVKPDGSIDTTLFTILKETNPILAGKALQQSVEKMKKRLAIEDSKDLLDMQKVQAEINKLNAEGVGTWSPTKLEDGSVVLVNGKTGETRGVTANTGATVIDTIKKFEGFRDKAYQDSTGTWTIGYGFTNVNGAPVQPGMTMDRGTADSLLQQEISQRQNFMNYITVPLSESQKAALSSFEFNLGSGIREKNAKPILDKINAGDLQGAGDLMKQYNQSKGQVLQGLNNRRNEEARLLMAKDTGGSQGTQAEESFANAIISGKAKISDITIKDGLNKANILAMVEQKTGNPVKTNSQEALNIVNTLIAHPGREAVTGVPNLLTNPFGKSLPASNARDFKSEVERLNALGFLNMIPQMKGYGQLTEAEGAKLSAAFSKIQEFGLPEDKYLAELKRIKTTLEGVVGKMAGETGETQSTASTGSVEEDFSKYFN